MEHRLEMYERAESFYGLQEIPGQEHDPTILGWFKDIGHKWVTTDETHWCSCFINWLAWSLRLEMSGELDARSWLKVGTPITEPLKGHLAIFWRGDPGGWKGHVGLFLRIHGSQIWVLGGNQNNQVKLSQYPYERLLGYRELNLKV